MMLRYYKCCSYFIWYFSITSLNWEVFRIRTSLEYRSIHIPYTMVKTWFFTMINHGCLNHPAKPVNNFDPGVESRPAGEAQRNAMAIWAIQRAAKKSLDEERYNQSIGQSIIHSWSPTIIVDNHLCTTSIGQSIGDPIDSSSSLVDSQTEPPKKGCG